MQQLGPGLTKGPCFLFLFFPFFIFSTDGGDYQVKRKATPRDRTLTVSWLSVSRCNCELKRSGALTGRIAQKLVCVGHLKAEGCVK